VSRRADVRAGALLILALVAAGGCGSKESAATRTVEVGRHRLRFAVPKGWEHLDRGRQQLFRSGETRLSLEEVGPATREGIVRELREAEQLWRAGQWRVAFARVHEMQSPTLRYASSDQRLDFYRQWNNVTYVPATADSAAIGPAFEALIEGAAKLPEPSDASLLQYALERAFDMRRMEIGRQEKKSIHGVEWTAVEVWDRVSHLWRLRLACVEKGGDLLVLSTEMGRIEEAGPAFDALLASIELLPEKADGGIR
jgi:hypothetical protein